MSIFYRLVYYAIIIVNISFLRNQIVYAQEKIIISSGNITGAYYAFAQKLCTALKDEDIMCKVILSSDSIKNIENLENKVADIAIIQQSNFSDYNDIHTNSQLHLISKLFDEAVTVITKKNSGINSPIDFINKNIGFSYIKNRNTDLLQKILSYYNVDLNQLKSVQYLPITSFASSLCNDEIDVLFFRIAHPNISTSEINNTCEINIMSFSNKLIDFLVKNHYQFHPYKLPHSVYNIDKNDITTIAMPALLVAKDSLDDNIRYQITLKIPQILEELKHF